MRPIRNVNAPAPPPMNSMRSPPVMAPRPINKLSAAPTENNATPVNTIENGNALDMPFVDETFDGAYSMNVSMNIEDKAGFYGEIFRVLKPGGWLVLSEVAQGPGGAITYPSPWARTAESSFLVTPEQTREGLEACGFEVTGLRDNIAESKAFAAKVRELVDRGEKPPHRAVSLIHGDLGDQAAKNMAEGSRNRCVVPIEVMCRKPD